jgi:hypothetical protein
MLPAYGNISIAMNEIDFPSWYFNPVDSANRESAATDLYNALSDGNQPAYLGALARWQAASGGLKGCPGALAQCRWNPPDTDPNATVIGFGSDAQGAYVTVGGVRFVPPAPAAEVTT